MRGVVEYQEYLSLWRLKMPSYHEALDSLPDNLAKIVYPKPPP